MPMQPRPGLDKLRGPVAPACLVVRHLVAPSSSLRVGGFWPARMPSRIIAAAFFGDHHGGPLVLPEVITGISQASISAALHAAQLQPGIDHGPRIVAPHRVMPTESES